MDAAAAGAQNRFGISLTEKDITRILKRYDVGSFSGIDRVMDRKQARAPLSYVISTGTGRYYLKQYRKRGFTEKALLLVEFLRGKGYPCVEIIRSNDGELDVVSKGKRFSLFRLLEGHTINRLTYRNAYQLGKYLGRLHVTAINFKMEKAYVTYNYFRGLFLKNCRKRMPARVRRGMEFMRENLDAMRFPERLPKSICHEEFTNEHVLFRNGKVVGVIDWDIAGPNHMFYDLGSSMYSAFYYDKGFHLSFSALKGIIAGYSSERKLTDWERGHLYEALLFGVFKNSMWHINCREVDWNAGDIRILAEMAKYRKGDFSILEQL